MYTEPASKPRWTIIDTGWAVSDNDVVNSTSGENNVSEPPEAKKDLGWDFREYPPRQWDNWFKRLVSKWIPYLNQEANAAVRQNYYRGSDFGALTSSPGGTIATYDYGASRIQIPPMRSFIDRIGFLLLDLYFTVSGNTKAVYFSLPDGITLLAATQFSSGASHLAGRKDSSFLPDIFGVGGIVGADNCVSISNSQVLTATSPVSDVFTTGGTYFVKGLMPLLVDNVTGGV